MRTYQIEFLDNEGRVAKSCILNCEDLSAAHDWVRADGDEAVLILPLMHVPTATWAAPAAISDTVPYLPTAHVNNV